MLPALLLYPAYFNPRSHERSDYLQCQRLRRHYISIHAPTRGATVDNKHPLPRFCKFQSTLPREERPLRECGVCGKGKFQSTLPREERLDHSPKPPVSTFISIHAPTRGATRTEGTLYKNKDISIHAPTRGATALIIVFDFIWNNFNPRSHERSDNAQSIFLA